MQRCSSRLAAWRACLGSPAQAQRPTPRLRAGNWLRPITERERRIFRFNVWQCTASERRAAADRSFGAAPAGAAAVRATKGAILRAGATVPRLSALGSDLRRGARRRRSNDWVDVWRHRVARGLSAPIRSAARHLRGIVRKPRSRARAGIRACLWYASRGSGAPCRRSDIRSPGRRLQRQRKTWNDRHR